MSKQHLGSSLNVSFRNFFIYSIVSFLFRVFGVNLLLLIMLHWEFLRAFQAQVFLSALKLPQFDSKFVSPILVEGIIPTLQLVSWALNTPNIVLKFMLDFHPFLLKAIGASSLGLLFSHVHLKLVQELLPLMECVPHFEQLAKKRVDYFRNVFQKNYMTIFFLTSSLICLLIRIGCT